MNSINAEYLRAGMPAPIVWVVDDDKGVRRAVAFLLESVDLQVRTFASADDFLDAYEPDVPGCIVLDIRMPGTSGVALQQALLERGWDHRIIFLTAHADVSTAVEIMRAGAVDVIQKPFREQQLLDRVSTVLRENVRVLAGRATRGELEERLSRLTPREYQVMRLVVEGRSSRAIASELGISQRTVDVHRARMMKKLGVNSATKLVRMVMGAEE